jgi:hypothetical protein
VSDAPELRLTPEEQHRIWAMRLALIDITGRQPRPRGEKPWVLKHARQALIDEINARGGDWALILEEVLVLLDSALMHMFNTPDDSGSGHVVDLKAIGAWLADELDGELYRIEHDL